MSIKKNFLYNIAYQILVMILPLITAPYISRVIGAEGVGIYSYTYSIANYFVLFSMLGLNNYGNRCIAAVRDDKSKLSETFFEIYGLQIITTVFMIGLYFVYIFLFNPTNKLIMFIQSGFVIASLLDINWLFFGLEQFKLTVLRNTIVKLITVSLIFIFVKDANSLWIYTVIIVVGTLFSQGMLWGFFRKYIDFKKPTLKGIVLHLKPNLTLFIPVISISIYKIMDKIMLGSMSSMIQVGYYENSEKIINIPMGIIAALGIVMLPRMTNLNANGNYETAKVYIDTSLKFIMFLAIGIALGLLGISPKFIPLFFGEQFINAIPVVSILAFTVLFLSWANVIRTQYLIPQKKDKIYIVSTILGALVNVIVNIIFISSYGAVGAAIGTIFAEATVAIYQTWKVRYELDIIKYLKNTLIYALPGGVMYLVIIFIGGINFTPIISILIQVIIGGLIYVILSGIGLYLFDSQVKDVVRSKIKKYDHCFNRDK